MSKASFTTNKQPVNSADNVVNTTSDMSLNDDFVIMCLSGDSGLQQAVLALYYLPPQFKLRVLTDVATSPKISFAAHEAIRSRITIETTSNPSADAAYNNANVVVVSDPDSRAVASKTARVVISESDFNVSEVNTGLDIKTQASPEAVASAILQAARLAA